MNRFGSRGGVRTSDVAIISIVVILVALILGSFPRPMRAQSVGQPTASDKARCQNNMKELGLALIMYYGDYDAMLPSSFLCGRSKTWNAQNFSKFASLRGNGKLPPGDPSSVQSWPVILYPYMKNKDIIWCPSDPGRGEDPAATVSYYYKAAVDRAWYAGCKKDGDFDYPSDQVVFWEHNGWHWGDQSKGATNGVIINMTFVDGHVAAKRIADSGYTVSENPPGPLPKSGKGEPAWFNADMFQIPLQSVGVSDKWDPHRYGDVLPGRVND